VLVGRDDISPGSGTLVALDRLRWSNADRKMHRKGIDGGMPGPPFYFTRRRDGIPVPSLPKFIAG